MVSPYVDVRYATAAPPIRDVDLAAPAAPALPAGAAAPTPEGWEDTARGDYLCEGCQDVMTDTVLPASACLLGIEMACCPACLLRLQTR